MASLFITGISGFIGRRLIQKIDPAKYERVYCLSRHLGASLDSVWNRDKCEFIRGSILEPEVYAWALSSTDTVLHLAAVTGKRPQQEYFAINSEGTQVLLEQCKRAGVRRFLHISSIAVKYFDKSMYPYAQSKELAELTVRKGGVPHTIVRPTIVIGADSPTLKTLLRLATIPIIPIFGNGKSIIQPIYIDDLIDCLLSILDEGLFANDTIELGGPEQITFERFLATIHRLYRGKEPRTIRVPLTPFLYFLSIIEKQFYWILPVTAGQLTVFKNDGTIKANAVFEQHKPQMKSIDEMLNLVLENEQSGGKYAGS